MLAVRIAWLKLCHRFAELMLSDQVAGQEQVNRVVQGSPAHAVLLVLHLNIKRFHVKVSFRGVDLIKDGKTLWRLSMTILLKITLENAANFLFDLGALHQVGKSIILSR